jgi:23S rRNA (adenine2503-C2)-methyltransferase
MKNTKRNLLGMNEDELAGFMDSIGEAPYRGRQLFRWLYEIGVQDFSSMTNLQKDLRHQLEQKAELTGLQPVTDHLSPIDGTRKFLFELADGLRIETVLIPPTSAFQDAHAAKEEEQKKLTLCVSAQAGCPLDCAFCATATMGFSRNLTVGEIIDQILRVRRVTGRTITNVVFMGMGEPMLNYDNVFAAADIMTAGLGVAARRITVSTAGWADRIRKMGDEGRKVKLAISLHSAVDSTRTALMPINKRFNLATLLDATRHYYRETRRRVTYEYIFFDGINDSDRELAALVNFARQVPCKINVIPFHPIGSAGPRELRPSPRVPELVERLRRQRLTVLVRSNAGEDINAACGQLAVRSRRRVPSSDFSLQSSNA